MSTIERSRVSSPSSSEPNLVVRGLSKTFSGVRVLDRVGFEVRHGEVHGLLGQNGSGKSTLIKILAGVHAPDRGGEAMLGGRQLPLPLPPGDFNKFGIAIVHQALGLVPSLSVTENLLVRRLVRDGNTLINWSGARRDAAALFASYGLDIDPAATVQSLPPVERALLAIVRAFHEIAESAPSHGGLIILDEPTPFLSRTEVDRLFGLVRQAVARGTSVLFVSHDIDEVMELTDRATVLRNGQVSATLETRASTRDDFISAIVGRRLEGAPAAPRSFSGRPAVTIAGLSGGGIGDFDLAVHPGEIIGLTGLIGSAYDRVVHLIYGAERPQAGRLEITGRNVDLRHITPELAIDLGMILVPADRQGAAVVEGLSVAENVIMPMLGKAFSHWFIPSRKVDALAARLVTQFDVRPPMPSQLVRSLSGGNQQKVVLAKWFQCAPGLILLDEPTQGVDVGARQQVFEIIRQAAASGACVICASSDHEQLASICDRVLIFSRGAVVATLTGGEVDKQTITTQCYDSLDMVAP